jgi:hypothetical protein
MFVVGRDHRVRNTHADSRLILLMRGVVFLARFPHCVCSTCAIYQDAEENMLAAVCERARISTEAGKGKRLSVLDLGCGAWNLPWRLRSRSS